MPVPRRGPWRCLLAGWEDVAGHAAVSGRGARFSLFSSVLFRPSPAWSVSSSRACMQSVSARPPPPGRPGQQPREPCGASWCGLSPPHLLACINSPSWPAGSCRAPCPLSGAAGAWWVGVGGGQGWRHRDHSGSQVKLLGVNPLSVGLPGPALLGRGAWPLSTQTLRAPAFTLLTSWPERSEVAAQ